MKTGEYVKLKKPEFAKVHGQGEPPKYWLVKYSGKVYKLHFGDVFKLTTKFAPVGDPEKGLLNINFAKTHKENFKKIKK